jgi:GNAT superfamily N-acetyltransferase
VQAPELLNDSHKLEDFTCGELVLDDWLKKRARPNQTSGASRTYVVAEGERVIGYYCLSSGAVAAVDAPGGIRRNMPDPIPMAILGRLAIDQNFQGQGIGTALLRDAVLRAGQAASIMGIRGILVHALGEKAKAFYESLGFKSSPNAPLTLILSLKQPE